jgi:2-polyprenyl-3-methyl-5-hydroxy-6-metoxy-1,4-benzoquinol methylase
MSAPDRRAHWDGVYRTKREDEVSWFQASPTLSLDLIHAAGVERHASIIDVGGGASRLVDALSDKGFANLTVLDVSEAATETAKARLGARAAGVTWIVADVTQWEPAHTYDVWHDRAAFHFLTAPEERAAYAQRVLRAVRPGGHVIIGTFALDGPERCSGLPIVRHDAESIGTILGPLFSLIETRRHEHQTPMGGSQKFQFSRFQRV